MLGEAGLSSHYTWKALSTIPEGHSYEVGSWTGDYEWNIGKEEAASGGFSFGAR